MKHDKRAGKTYTARLDTLPKLNPGNVAFTMNQLSEENRSGGAQIGVEVAYATPAKQRIIALKVSPGISPLEAARLSGICNEFEGLSLETAKMGIFGKAVDPEKYALKEGDRVEIYRPLLVDPKEVRKARAAKARAQKS